MHTQLYISHRNAPLMSSKNGLSKHRPDMHRCEDPNPLNHPDEEEDVPMPPDDPARKAPIDEPPSPSIPKRAQA